MKPNTRILDYTTLVQDGVLTLDDVPQDIKSAVTKWVRYLSGASDDGMVKDTTTVTTPTVPAVVEKKVNDSVNGTIN
ncbi:hypothetical protein EFS28_10410 [Lactobacillus acidophilus]|nr:hypothetical protein [Lactobacillus acidophilus]MCT3603228.1 hypothetical protein [Lactobacillus acidophilus]MCT3624597.1 hypothetical protein [Lactobacillus acidophilus]